MSKFNEQTVISKNLIAQEKSEDGSVLWQITAKGTLQVSVAAIETWNVSFIITATTTVAGTMTMIAHRKDL